MTLKTQSKKRLSANQAIRLQANEVTAESGKYLAVLCAEGHVRYRNGRNSNQYMTVDALQAAVENGTFSGAVAILDHPQFLSDPEVKNICGHWTNIQFDAERKAVTAELALMTLDGELTQNAKDAKALMEMYLQADEEEKPDIGVSIVFYAEWEWEEKLYYCTHIENVESGDLVVMPAIDQARILARLSALDPILNPSEEDFMDPEENNGTGGETTGTTTAVPSTLTAPPAGEPAESNPAPIAPPAMTVAEADAWAQQLQATSVNVTLQNSGLPAVSITRLQGINHRTPAALNTAIEAERAYLADLNQHYVVQMSGNAPRITGGKTALDEARDIVNWAFGAHEDPDWMPEPAMRKFDVFYAAFTGDQDFHGVFRPEKSQFTGASTVDLPNLAVDALNKRMIALMTVIEAYRWYETVFGVEPNDGSWQPIKLLPYSGVGNLPIVAEQAPYGALTPADGKEEAIFSKRGAYIPLTLEMMKKSQIGKMQAIPRMLLEAAYRTRSATCASIFTANSGVGPGMADNNPVFSGGNVGALPLTATHWKAVSNACYQQVLPGSGDLNAIRPEFALLHSDGYFDALETFGYGRGETTTINALFEGRGNTDPRPKPIQVPDFTDSDDWAAICNPVLRPTLCVSYGSGARTHQRPEVFTMTGETSHSMFHNDQILVKVRDVFTVGVSSRIGIFKQNP